jgi:hypothetical protein
MYHSFTNSKMGIFFLLLDTEVSRQRYEVIGAWRLQLLRENKNCLVSLLIRKRRAGRMPMAVSKVGKSSMIDQVGQGLGFMTPHWDKPTPNWDGVGYLGRG